MSPGRSRPSLPTLAGGTGILRSFAYSPVMTADPSVLESMRSLGIMYEEMPCDPALADTARFCEAYGVPLDRSANTILVASRRPEGHVTACLVLATTRLDVNGVVRRRMGVKKASFADADQTKEMTGMEI